MNRIAHTVDCITIQRTLLNDFAIEATLAECQYIWKSISDDNDANWLMVNAFDPPTVRDMLRSFLDGLGWNWPGPYAVPT